MSAFRQKRSSARNAALVSLSSNLSFAAQCTNGRNADNQPFVMHALNVSVAGLSRLLLMQLLLTQKMFATAAVGFWRCSEFLDTSHSCLINSTDFKLSHRRESVRQSRRGTNPLYAALPPMKAICGMQSLTNCGLGENPHRISAQLMSGFEGHR